MSHRETFNLSPMAQDFLQGNPLPASLNLSLQFDEAGEGEGSGELPDPSINSNARRVVKQQQGGV
ncbi:MAG: hypothetical protein A3C35_07345 [Omnitrophica bacterium RIFCSPHIGHO2_02_FULL_46_11]|nr:MAG: hypothetical protein A3C35_07345 [Omnitrophica bacterium RIFCSPHIGHO2_02_FULL_46_11]